MQRTPVKSSNVAAIGYDLLNQKLEVEFTNGDVYVYSNVPELVHLQLMSAPSVGKAVHLVLRGKYNFVKKGN